jgi:hypothetical protein
MPRKVFLYHFYLALFCVGLDLKLDPERDRIDRIRGTVSEKIVPYPQLIFISFICTRTLHI